MSDFGYGIEDVKFTTRNYFDSSKCHQLKNERLIPNKFKKLNWLDIDSRITEYNPIKEKKQYCVDTYHIGQIVIPRESTKQFREMKELDMRIGNGIPNSKEFLEYINKNKELEQQQASYDIIHREPTTYHPDERINEKLQTAQKYNKVIEDMKRTTEIPQEIPPQIPQTSDLKLKGKETVYLPPHLRKLEEDKKYFEEHPEAIIRTDDLGTKKQKKSIKQLKKEMKL